MRIYDDDQINLLRSERKGLDEFDAITNVIKSSNNSDALYMIFKTDLDTQLPDDLLILTDKMSMATSLECRVPLLDKELVELAAKMPSQYKIKGRELKYILKKSLANDLPKEILYRKKRGFGAPMGAWIKRELSDLTGELLSEKAIEFRGILDYSSVTKIVQEHNNNVNDYTDLILAMINFEIWARLYIDGMSHEDISQQLSSMVLH